MSDIERRLQAAGEQWRAHQPPSQVHPEPRLRRSRWLPAVAAAAVVGLALAATGLATRLQQEEAAGRAGPSARQSGWDQMPASPLSPRLRPIMAGWRDAVVIVGGRNDRPCPPNASCARGTQDTLRDGAVYDLPSRTWRQLPDAPLPLDAVGFAVLSDVLYVSLDLPEGSESRIRILALNLATSRWTELPAPPTVAGCCLRLAAAGTRLVAYYNEQGHEGAVDLVYVPATRTWEQLPPAPFDTSFDRVMVWTGSELVLVTPGQPPGPRDNGPPFLRAAVLSGSSWRELPSQKTVIFGATDWSWTGSRVVSATTQTADGGQTNGFGRAYPSGGYLDPVAGTWSTLPAPPGGQRRTSPAAAGGRWVANGEGLVLDTLSNRWLEPADQPDAADQDASAAWAGGRLAVWGGAAGVSLSGSDARLLSSGSVWTPPND